MIFSLFFILSFYGRAFPFYGTLKPVKILRLDEKGFELKTPSGIFYDAIRRELYVISPLWNKIVIYNDKYFPFLSIGRGRGIERPFCIWVSESGRFYVAQKRYGESFSEIVVLDRSLIPEKRIILKGFREEKKLVPVSIAVDEHEGKIYLAGMEIEGCLIFDMSGTYLGRISPIDKVFPKVKGTQKRAVINYVYISSGKIYLLSEEMSRIYVYDKRGNLLLKFGEKGGSSGKMSRPKALAINEKKNRIYVIDYMRHTILVYDTTGNYLYEVGGKGWLPGWFNFPVSIAVDAEGNLIIDDLFNNRIQVLSIKEEFRGERRGPTILSPSFQPLD